MSSKDARGAGKRKPPPRGMGVAHDSATRRRASHAGVPGGKHPQPPQRQSAEAKVVRTEDPVAVFSPSNLYRPNATARKSLAGGAKIELHNMLHSHSSHEVAIDILPATRRQGVKTEGMKTQAEGIRKFGSFTKCKSQPFRMPLQTVPTSFTASETRQS